ncbi:Pup deamidase/depupylase [Dermatophilus congolensis]|uniref:Pup deamidase/depupylase n=1 Tax=Dermatophilus congolensis TaxID=1863 RepID=A0A239VMG3_9MICO|nr:depupylase/deamidase Dop [Dermatophilus congolensis]SNV23009.1 Pup deamidase/depupylase [Dermatophilus congolensis]
MASVTRGCAGVHRVVGLETEFGITVAGDPHANPMTASELLVQAYGALAAARGHRVARWDYAGESPLVDARGWTLDRGCAQESMRTDEVGEDLRLASLAAPNGARVYVDHAHPEYSGPECVTPRQAVMWDRAGEVAFTDAAAMLTGSDIAAASSGGERLVLYKNNTDGKGASYGSHENYLVDRGVAFERIAELLIPFFVVRQVLAGAGRVGLGQRSQVGGFQLGARSDFMEALVGLETTFRRPIINTRDEPHADPGRFRRLHVIIGDANLADVSALLKVGSTSLVLGLIEGGVCPRFELADPLAELVAVSRDVRGRHRLRLVDGRHISAVEMLRAYWQAAAEHAGVTAESAPDTYEVLYWWDEVLTRLADGPEAVSHLLDWAAKWAVVERYRAREGGSWDSPKLRAVDIQWADTRPEVGVARVLERAGRLHRLVPEDDVAAAVWLPPGHTRAWLRGRCVDGAVNVVAASWETLVLEDAGVSRLWCVDPALGARDQVGDDPVGQCRGDLFSYVGAAFRAVSGCDFPVDGRLD